MINCLFTEEQKIIDDGFSYLEEVKNGVIFDPDKYHELLKEYRRLLKHLRRSSKMADKQTSSLRETNLDLTEKINHDALTGIYNRRFMEDSLNRIIKSISRSEGKLSVMMVDIDFFKKYNDTYGHVEGDSCLKAVAEVLAASITRADDFTARYGGEEFAVILPSTDENGARIMARKILENIRTRNIPHEKNKAAGCVTVSIGVTTGLTVHTQSGVDYIKRADEALYMSKQNGRNRFTHITLKEIE